MDKTVYVSIEEDADALPAALSRDTLIMEAGRVLEYTGYKNAELSILISGMETIESLNSQYRHKNRPTDVLSFSQQEGEAPGVDNTLLGDVVICSAVARHQARENNMPYKQELRRLLVHGILHLVGYDHETGGVQAEEMFAVQEKTLNRLEEDFAE